MNRYLAIAALVGIISLTGFSIVSAQGNYGLGPGRDYGMYDGCGYCDKWSYNEQDREKTAVFFEETKEARKQIAVKRSERRALMKQDNPDEKKVARLTGEIFDLKDLLDEKAKETFGDNPPFGCKHARGRRGCCGRGTGSL